MLKSEKPKEMENVIKLLNEYNVVGILDMHKIPGRQLQKIRENLRDKVVIRMCTKNILMRSIDDCNKKNIFDLKEQIRGASALILTNENPFRLFKMIKKNRSPAKARLGDVVKKDIVIPKGSTELPPGPAISTLQKVGLKTGVQQGKIAIMQEKVILKSGESVNEDVVNLLSLLKIEPMEIGLELIVVIEDGIIYKKEVLDVDDSYYENEMISAVQKAINLSVNSGYPTEKTVEIMIQKAFNEVKNLCVDLDLLEKDFVDDIIIKTIRQATVLEELTK